ncbi:unnamed protein product [Prorocentrum cordatum]|uniref:C3H1-type domain-containing protein n=1 Tax=Prorocentrum cordatum TaxID=2364126 RepID=A0ABN9S2I3_9DINO|nr:unnamed protein product [Polarella glacialis]
MPAAAPPRLRLRLALDAMIATGQPSAGPAPGAPPPRGGKGGRRPRRAGAGRAERGEAGGPMVGPLWKTRLCNFHASGGCRNSSECPFAHGEGDLRPSPDFERTSVCPALLSRGQCDRPGCRYAHHAEELRVQKGLLKTKMCAFYQSDHCIVGEACRFAHSEREIQEALAMQRAAAQGAHQPPPPLAEPAAQKMSNRQLWRSSFVAPLGDEAAPALASGSLGNPRQLPERPGQRAARELSPLAPSAADSSGPKPARVPLPAFSLTAPPGLLEFPARVSDSKVVIDAGLAEIEGMVLDIEEEVIASNVLLESGLPQKVPLPAPYSSRLLARVVTLEEEIAELGPREPAAPLVAELTKARLEHGRPGAPPAALGRRRKLTIGVRADLDELGLDDGAGGGGSVRAGQRYAGCALCPRANGSHAAGGGACAACTCGVKVVSRNTFLTTEDEEAQEAAARRAADAEFAHLETRRYESACCRAAARRCRTFPTPRLTKLRPVLEGMDRITEDQEEEGANGVGPLASRLAAEREERERLAAELEELDKDKSTEIDAFMECQRHTNDVSEKLRAVEKALEPDALETLYSVLLDMVSDLGAPVEFNQHVSCFLPMDEQPEELVDLARAPDALRPLALQNTSSKASASMIDRSLRSVAEVRCHPIQRGFLKG